MTGISSMSKRTHKVMPSWLLIPLEKKKMKKRKEHVAPSNDKIFVLTGERRNKKIEKNGRHSCKF